MTDTAALAAAISDRYTLGRELGRGGMATVYLARDIRHDRQVALKLLHPELGAVLGAERFLSEIRTTANLQHPNILPLFDSGAAAGLVFYVMPYITGETLRDKLAREGQLSVAEALRITRGVAAALDYAHRQGVIHRDIKPENILLQDGQPLVADFGIALAVSNAGGTRITQTGLSVGTPAYMSPEQAAAERQLDGRSDQYSLASVLYELLAGAPPFTGASAAAVMSRLMTEVPRPVNLSRPAVPDSVADALARALEKVPGDRYETVAHFADALDADASSGYRASRVKVGDGPWKRRAIVVGAFGVLASALSWVVPRTLAPVSDSESGTPRFFSIALPDSLPLVPGRDRFGSALRSLDISGDGRSVAYTTERGDTTQLALANLGNGTVSLLAETRRGNLPSFSPDDRTLAFVQDTLIRRIGVDGSGTMTLGPARTTETLAWGRDGRVYASEYSSCLRSVPENGGVVRIDSAAGCPALIAPTHQKSTKATPIVVNYQLHLLPANGGIALPVQAADAKATDSAGVSGAHPILVDDEYLVFTRDSTLFAAPIDVASARLKSAPRVLFTGIRTEQFPVQAHMGLSAEGTFVWVSGGDAARAHFVRVRRDGSLIDTLQIPSAVVTSFTLTPDGKKVAWSVPPSTKNQLFVHDIERGVTESYASVEPLVPISWVRRTGETLIAMRDGWVTFVRPVGQRIEKVDAPRTYDESQDGRWRCRAAIVWPTARQQDSVLLRPPLSGQCRFSANGEFVVVKSDDGMFVAPTARLDPSNVVRISTFGDEPRWTADSRAVIFRNGDEWYEVPLDLSGKPRSEPVRLFKQFFNQADNSWGLDEQGRFLMLKGPPVVRTTRINVITNFPRFVADKLR